MNEDVIKLINLQNDMRVKLLEMGISEKESENTSCIFFQSFIDSNLIKQSSIEALNNFLDN